MSAGKQHSFRVPPQVKTAFGRYASGLGMRESELARLLIVRELRHQQLRMFMSGGGPVTSGSGGDDKVTAHFPTEADLEALNAYANSCGVGLGRAGAWIIERELNEHWFENALSQRPAA